MFRSHRVLVLVLVALPAILPPTDPEMQSAGLHYRAQTTRWRAADGQFAGWQLSGVALIAGGSLQLDPRTAQTGTDPYGPGKYKGGNFYNGGSFVVGEATGPVVAPAFSFSEVIPSWNAVTPPGTWLEVQLRARM